MLADHEIQLLPPALNRLALVQLMQSGAYDRHLRASRQRYRARRNVLTDALRRHLPELRVRGAEAGVQLLLELPSGTDLEDQRLSRIRGPASMARSGPETNASAARADRAHRGPPLKSLLPNE